MGSYKTQPIQNDYVHIAVDVVGIDHTDLHQHAYKHRMNGIRDYLCRFALDVNREYVQIMKPYVMEDGDTFNGLQLQIHVIAMEDGSHYEELLNAVIDSGEFQKVIQ